MLSRALVVVGELLLRWSFRLNLVRKATITRTFDKWLYTRILSNSYTLGFSARSILIGRVNLLGGVCGVYTVAYIQQQIQQLIYNTAETVANIQ
jgi:hypothetical protein